GDGFFGAQGGVVEAAEERGQLRPGAGDLVQDGGDLGGGGDGGWGGGGDGLGDAPADLVEGVGGPQLEFGGVAEGAVEHGSFAADRVGCGGCAVEAGAEAVEGGPDD